MFLSRAIDIFCIISKDDSSEESDISDGDEEYTMPIDVESSDSEASDEKKRKKKSMKSFSVPCNCLFFFIYI